MKGKFHAALVAGLSIALFFIIAIGSGQTGTVSDCASCHSGSRPEGNFIFKEPTLTMIVPDNVTSSTSFQVVVILREREDYDLLDPILTVTSSGADIVVGEGTMEGGDGSWKSSFKVIPNYQGPVVLDAKARFMVHYDHSGADEPDLSSMELTASTTLTVELDDGRDFVPEDAEGERIDETDLGLGPVVLGALLFAGLVLWRRGDMPFI